MGFPDYPDNSDPRAPWNEVEECYRHGCEETASRSDGFCSLLCRDMDKTGHDGTEPCPCCECDPTSAANKLWNALEHARLFARIKAAQQGVTS